MWISNTHIHTGRGVIWCREEEDILYTSYSWELFNTIRYRGIVNKVNPQCLISKCVNLSCVYKVITCWNQTNWCVNSTVAPSLITAPLMSRNYTEYFKKCHLTKVRSGKTYRCAHTPTHTHMHVSLNNWRSRQWISSCLRAQQTPAEKFGFAKQPLINTHLQTPTEVNMSTHTNKAAVKLFYSTIWWVWHVYWAS